jgi:hypothetical protein
VREVLANAGRNSSLFITHPASVRREEYNALMLQRAAHVTFIIRMQVINGRAETFAVRKFVFIKCSAKNNGNTTECRSAVLFIAVKRNKNILKLKLKVGRLIKYLSFFSAH